MQRGDASAFASTSELTLDRLDSAEINYVDFCEKYLKGNTPCIFSPNLIQGWDALDKWTNGDARLESGGDRLAHLGDNGTFDRLGRCYADHVAPVDLGNGEERREMSIADAVKLINDEKGPIYIKDWHLIRQERIKEGNKVKAPYEVPRYFADDWMNNRQNDNDDDFRFCYAGTAGTRTNIHRDVYTSYSWSTNVVGRKLWRLFPPSAKAHLRKYPLVSTSELASSVDQLQEWALQDQLGHVKAGKLGWPEWQLAMQQCIEVLQEERETFFVPSDWHHEVINLTDCISINHNWCNSTNIASMYQSMCSEVNHVEEALCDVKAMMKEQGQDWQLEWTATVQQVLASNSGWGWSGFWEMVEHNLLSPPCAAPLRPALSYVASQILPCLSDFVLRHDYPFLSKATQVAAQHCEMLLKGLTDERLS